jgi:hypothetical protein
MPHGESAETAIAQLELQYEHANTFDGIAPGQERH